MARTVLTYGGLNLNDGTNYFLLPGFDPGAEELSYDEIIGLNGGVIQTNVTEAHFITMTVPLRIQGSSLSDLDSKVQALNAKIAAGPQTLVYGSTSYDCARSQRVSYAHGEYGGVFVAFVTFQPLRLPKS